MRPAPTTQLSSALAVGMKLGWMSDSQEVKAQLLQVWVVEVVARQWWRWWWLSWVCDVLLPVAR